MNTELHEIQQHMLAAIYDKQMLDSALARVSAYAGTPVVQMISGGEGEFILDSHLYGVDQSFREREAAYWEINPRFAMIPFMRQLRVLRDQDFISKEEMDKSPVYQELLYPSGVGYFAGVMLENSPERTVGIAVAQDVEAGPITGHQAERLKAVGEVIQPLIKLASSLSLAQADTALAASGYKPAAVVRRDRVLLRANAAFDALLSDGLLQIDRKGRLDLGAAAGNKELVRGLSKPVISANCKFVVRNAALEAPLVCSLYPLPVEDVMLKRGNVALLQLEAVSTPRKLDQAIVADVFCLTRAETDVARMLFEGCSSQQIAQMRGTKISTVRTLIKSVLAKTECRRQAELVSKLSRFTREAGPERDNQNN